MRLGFLEIAIIVVVVLLLFGSTLIPKLFKSGKNSIRVAKKELEQAKEEMTDEFKKDNTAEKAK
jgi:Sec-independent protein translocase protein TatA